jgi:poly(3-hydroxyoctanoate) depolymerase
MSTTAEVRSLAVRGRQLRIAVRPGVPSSRAPRTPLLLINGIGASLELLEPFVSQLDPGLDVIRFDPPGLGGSAEPSGPYRFTGLCGLVASMLTSLGHSRVDVLGISWGGAVAQHIPQARLHIFRGGHLGLVTEAAELAPIVDDFLTAF